jgi:hypothetical protein
MKQLLPIAGAALLLQELELRHVWYRMSKA